MSKDFSLKGITSILSKESKILGTVLGITIGLFLIYKLISKGFTEASLALAVLPLAFVILLFIVSYYRRIFYFLFISHFLILLVSSYYNIMIGAVTLLFNIVIVMLLVLVTIYRKTTWKNCFNGMFILYLIWGLYCVAELGNPNSIQYAWNISITHYVVYPIICAVTVPLAIRKYKNIQWLLLLWSVFVLIAAIKGFWQKTYGFNDRELYFLFELGGEKTHIIWSGIRYFSFFTDAANFGVHMAMAAFIFGMYVFQVKNKLLKIYFLLVALAAVYGFFISGTRTAMIIPLVGLIYYAILSRNWKAFFLASFAALAIFLFFRFTYIGSGNLYIHKMRSAFTPKNDASFHARIVNRELMKKYMKDMPFGYGLGLGGKAERFRPKKMIPIPPDSWLINVWTDTGYVGFIIYILIHVILFAWCSWIIMFKLQSKRLRNILAIWLCIDAGFFAAAYGNDVMQYPNMIVVFSGFALCFAGPHIEKFDKELQENNIKKKQITPIL